MDYDPRNPVPSLERQALEMYFNVETESMAAEGYGSSLRKILRAVALREILKNSKCFNFDAFVPYLAMNYFDRFISRNPLPNVLGRVRDDVVLAAISCLTLAWKMRDETFRFRNLVATQNLNEDYKNHILAMELHILTGLNWRLRAVTAICFVLLFSEKIPVGRSIKRRTLNEIIIQSQGDVCFTRFKPSVIAASALLTSCRFLYANEYDKCKADLLAYGYIKEEDLESCLHKIYKMCTEYNIQFERNEKPTGVKAEGASSSISIKEPTQEIEREPYTSSISHRPGQNPLEILSTLKDSETKIDPILTSRRAGKQPVPTITDIMEAACRERENDAGLNFELKWKIWGAIMPEENAIHSPDFRPGVHAAVSDPSAGTSTISGDDSDLVAPPKCCVLM